MIIYPHRDAIVSEVHARPFQNIEAPISMMQVAVLYDDREPEEIEARVFEVIQEAGFAVDPEKHGYLFCSKGDQGIRYEPHNDFYTLTLYQYEGTEPIDLPPLWREHLPGALLIGVQVLLRKQGDDFYGWAAQHFGSHQLTSSSVIGGAALICTDFHLQPDCGMSRILVEDKHLRLPQAGRLLQRLCEIETYRHTALLTLSRARDMMPKLTELDHQLASIAQRTGVDDPQTLLSELMALSGHVESLSAATANDFAASEAHFAMVELRIRELREVRVEGLQMVEEFMDRRLDPARRTCRSASARLDNLSTRIARTTQLIRSQVDLAIEQQNRDLLESMNRRSRRQLRLQAKLEGLSVIILTYYFYDLVDTALKNVLPEGDLRSWTVFTLTLSLPLVVLFLYWAVRRTLKGVHGDDLIPKSELEKRAARAEKTAGRDKRVKDPQAGPQDK